MVNCPLCNARLHDEDSECKCNVQARWIVELNVICPWCGWLSDLMTPRMEKSLEVERDMEFEFCTTQEDLDIKVTCPECKKEYFITSTEY